MTPVESSAVLATTCGNAFYDDGETDTVFNFGGGGAGDPDNMFAVWIALDDFGFVPGETVLTGFCVGNDVGTTGGGAEETEVFIYPHPQGDGWPNPFKPLGRATVVTGDGSGQYEVRLPAPVVLDVNDFWIVNRGDPSHEGGSFAAYTDSDSATAHSYASTRGIYDLSIMIQENTLWDFIFRAELEELSAPRCSDEEPTCPDGLVCQFPPSPSHCGFVGLAGVCGDPAGYCPPAHEPVCGCDGETYFNDCVRTMAGATLAHYGECLTSGPDLQIAEVEAHCVPGRLLQIRVVECNLGTAPAAAHLTGLWVSADDNLDFDDLRFRFTEIRFPAGSEPGDCHEVSGTISAGGSRSYYFGAIADDNFRVPELDEGNNAMLGNEILLPCPYASPEADFSWSPSLPVVGEAVRFSDRSRNDPSSWSWDFGDGSSSSERGPTHTYAGSGEYTVTLSTSNQLGESVVSKTVVVDETSSMVDFSFEPSHPAPGEQVTFSLDTGDSRASVVEWDFGAAGCIGSPQRATCATSWGGCATWVHRFAETGTFQVAVTATVNGRTVGPTIHEVVVAGVGSCADGETCGNETCGTGETAATCPADCAATCGNAVCELGEDSWSCGRDCQPTCGNAFCEAGETVTSCAEDCPVPSDSTGLVAERCRDCLVPAAVGNQRGRNGTVWSSEAMLSNLDPEAPAVCWISYTPDESGAKDATVETSPTPLAPGQTLHYESFLEDVFGVSGEGGNVRVWSDVPMAVTTRIYNRDVDGNTYGQSLPAMDASTVLTWGQRAMLAGLEQSEEYRSNLIVQEVSGRHNRITVRISGPDGDVVVEESFDLPARRSLNLNLGSDLGVTNLIDGFATVRIAYGGQVAVVGSVIDQDTGDPVTIRPIIPERLGGSTSTGESRHTLVPVVARAAGFEGTVWRTRLVMLNLEGAQQVQMVYYPSDGSAPVTRDVNLEEEGLLVDRDIVATLVGDVQGQGTLHLYSPGEILVDSATRNVGATGTFGDGLPGLRSGDLLAQGEVGFLELLESSGRFRTNVGFAALGDEPAEVELTVYEIVDGLPVAAGATTLTVPARRNLQVNRAFRSLLGPVDLRPAKASVRVLSGGPVYVYASKVDNATGDATNIVAMPMR